MTKILIRRGVIQRDTISLKLFICTLESLFKNLNLNSKCIKVNDKYLNHFRFADDVVLMGSSTKDLQTIITNLNLRSNKIRFRITPPPPKKK